MSCPSQRLHLAIVPGDRTQFEFGDDGEHGHEKAWDPARITLVHRHTQTGSDEPAGQADVYDYATRE
jgi:hypothetical protein